MKSSSIRVWVMIKVILIGTGSVFGLVQYNDGGTHNINYIMNDDVWVDYLSPSMQTTVNIFSGGTILDPYRLQGFYDSEINISGGRVDSLLAFNRSQLTISDNGWVNGCSARNEGQIKMYGGTVRYLNSEDSGKIIMTGGQVQYLNVNESSQLTIDSGLVENRLTIYDNSRAAISGGSIHEMSIYGTSQATMSSGLVDLSFFITNNSLVEWSGGTIRQDLGIDMEATLKIYGSNFAIDGIPVDFGEITSILGHTYSSDPFRRLTGTLINGDIINTQFRIGENAKIVLTPEPSSILLFGLGSLFLRRKR